MGIYNGIYSVSPNILPPQNIPLKDKLAKPTTEGEKSWGQKCLDSLETIGKSQYNSNLRLVENYEMVRGRLIPNHYFHAEGYNNLISELTAEFELPNYLRHYDIISQVVNTLSGEWQKRPDLFRVKQLGDGATNEYLRAKVEMTKQYVVQRIESEINRKLLEKGIDINKNDFASQEEAQAYQEQLTQAKQALTPQAIQKYMDTDFLTQAEIWGQHQKDFDREYFNLAEKEKIEFEDMLIADRCFRHFYITPTGYGQETWNPITTFFHKSPDIIYIEDGDYVGRILNLSINTIIDRYGHLMTKEDLDTLQGNNNEDKTKWVDSQFSWVYNNYFVPFQGFPAIDIARQGMGLLQNNGEIPFADNNFFNYVNENSYFRERLGYYFVTEAYWKTQKKLFKITYIDEETQEIVVKIVDENYIIPDYFVESIDIFAEEHDVNTYCVTEINEVWKGIKINTSIDKNLKKDLYLAIQPNDFQFKGDFNIYGSKLPVCGQVFSVRNSHSMSLVDMMKPYQIGYNVVMNQLYQLAEKEIGMFVVMDVNMFPSSKDWGGEDAWDKWMLMAKTLGLLPADTSPQNVRNSLAATGGFLPKVIDLNLAAQMVSRMNIAKFLEEQALKQVGFNAYRTGAYSATSTAQGVEQGTAASYNQTETYFTNFSNYLRRCTQMALNMAQFVQSKKEDVTFTYIKGDLNRAFVKVLGTDLLLADLGVFVVNSQENARQLEMMRRFALENNTSGLTGVDMANIIMMNSPQQIKRELEVSYNKILEQQQQAQQLKQQELEQTKQLEDAKLQQENQHFYDKLENELEKAKIAAGAAIINSDTEIPQQPDNSQNELKAQQLGESSNIQNKKIALDQAKLIAQLEFNKQKLALEQAKINASLQIQQQQTETARILKGKESK